jgi:hypothetical protein
MKQTFLIMLMMFSMGSAVAKSAEYDQNCPGADKEPLIWGGIPQGWSKFPIPGMHPSPQGGLGAKFSKVILTTAGGIGRGLTCFYKYDSGYFVVFKGAHSVSVVNETPTYPWFREAARYRWICSVSKELCRFIVNED